MASPSTPPNPPSPTSPAAASRPPHDPEAFSTACVPLDLIAESKTNPRRTCNLQSDKELAESVRVHGVLQSVLLRRNGPPGAASYELVVGSRRFRAAKAAGLEEIPATIRELTDEQALEFQIVENLQREDIAPIDEGRGYSQLIAALAKKDPKRAADGQGVKRQDLVAEIAAKVGKSARYVYARMKLCELIPELQKDLEEGRIEASHADELVRLTPKDQKAVRDGGLFLKEREHSMDDEEYVPAWKAKTGKRAISVRNLKVIIERDYQLTLDKAKFPIESAALKPLACTVCPKNTAVNALLPPAAKPTCTDKECWRGKMRQHVEMQAQALAKKASSPKEELKKHHENALERFVEERETLEFQRRVLAKVEKFGEPELRLVARTLARSAWSNDRELAFVLGREQEVVASVLAKEAKPAELPRLILALLFSDANAVRGRLEPYAKSRGVDRGKLGAEIRAGLKTCEICGCFDQHGCDLGGGKRCVWIPKGQAHKAIKTQLCSNPLCLEEAKKRADAVAAATKKPAQSSAKPGPAKKAKGGRR